MAERPQRAPANAGGFRDILQYVLSGLSDVERAVLAALEERMLEDPVWRERFRQDQAVISALDAELQREQQEERVGQPAGSGAAASPPPAAAAPAPGSAAAAPEAAAKACASCGRMGAPKYKLCARCKAVRYCSKVRRRLAGQLS
jgi:hypothetical protein